MKRGWTTQSQVFTGTSPLYSSLISNINDTLNISNQFTAANTGTGYEKYEADYSVAAQGVTDDVPSTNVDTVYFLTSDNDYSRCLNDYYTLSTTDISIYGASSNMIISCLLYTSPSPRD